MRATKDRLFGCYLDSLAGKGAATDNTTTNGDFLLLLLLASYSSNDSNKHVIFLRHLGLFSSHAYSILKATEYKGKRFLKLRNPWGKSEWTGRWSDGSKEWSKEWLGALDALDHQFGDDGAFIMEYEDFLQTWYAVERTQLFDDSWVMSSHWLNVTGRTYPAAWQYGDVSCKCRFNFFLNILFVHWETFTHQSRFLSSTTPHPSSSSPKLMIDTGTNFLGILSGLLILLFTKKEKRR